MADNLQAFAAELRDRYTLERELGRGGMGTIYLAARLTQPYIVPVFDSGVSAGRLWTMRS